MYKFLHLQKENILNYQNSNISLDWKQTYYKASVNELPFMFLITWA